MTGRRCVVFLGKNILQDRNLKTAVELGVIVGLALNEIEPAHTLYFYLFRQRQVL
jgi:hypothetical protein